MRRHRLRGTLVELMIYAAQTVPAPIHMFRAYVDSVRVSLEESR